MTSSAPRSTSNAVRSRTSPEYAATLAGAPIKPGFPTSRRTIPDRAVGSDHKAFSVRFAGDHGRLGVMTAVAHPSLAAEIARVGKLGHLTAANLADATGGDPSSARRWLRGTRAPSGAHAVRALELTSVVERLVQVMHADYIPIWLIKPIERLDDRRPVDAIRAGDYRSVSQLVATLEGMPVS